MNYWAASNVDREERGSLFEVHTAEVNRTARIKKGQAKAILQAQRIPMLAWPAPSISPFLNAEGNKQLNKTTGRSTEKQGIAQIYGVISNCHIGQIISVIVQQKEEYVGIPVLEFLSDIKYPNQHFIRVEGKVVRKHQSERHPGHL